MPGQNGPDEAARLETALTRIARAATMRRPRPVPVPANTGLPALPERASSGTNAPSPAGLAARLDALIDELRQVLAMPPL